VVSIQKTLLGRPGPRFGRRLSIGLVVALAVPALAACGSSSSSSSSAGASSSAAGSSSQSSTTSGGGGLPPYNGVEAKAPPGYPVPTLKAGLHPTVAFLDVSNNEEGVAQADSAKAQAKKLGEKLILLFDNANVDKQVTDFNTALADGAKVIMYYPLDPKALGPSIARATKSGVKLLATDAAWGNLPLPTGLTSVMLNDRDQAAYMQVQQFSKLKPHAKIVIMNYGGAPVPALAYYISRVKYWSKIAGLTILGEQDNPTDDVAGGQQAMTALLSKYPDLDGIIAYNDPSALGANAAARARGKKIIAIGQNGGSDARTGIQHGQETASVYINAPVQVVQLLNAAYDLVANPSVSLPPRVEVPPALLTQSSLSSVPSFEQGVSAIQSSQSLGPPS
jgi:ribose transport system substrate-binding protein